MEEITAGKHDEQRKQGKRKMKAEVTLNGPSLNSSPLPLSTEVQNVNFHAGKSIFLHQELFDDFLAVCSVRKMQK